MFQALYFIEALVSQFYQARSPYHIKPKSFRYKLLQAYLQSKNRLAAVTRCDKSYLIRQEFRIHVSGLEELEYISINSPLLSDDQENRSQHLNYFVFNTSEVYKFLASSINRWLVLLENLIYIPDQESILS